MRTIVQNGRLTQGLVPTVLPPFTLVQNSFRIFDFATSSLCENWPKFLKERPLQRVLGRFARFLVSPANLDSIFQGMATSSWSGFRGPLFSMVYPVQNGRFGAILDSSDLHSDYPVYVVVEGLQGPRWQSRMRDAAGSTEWSWTMEAAAPAAHAEAANRDQQSLGIPAKLPWRLEMAARFAHLPQRLLG